VVRSVLLLAGLCGVLAGCSWGGGDAGHSGTGTGPNLTFRSDSGKTWTSVSGPKADQWAARQVTRLRLPNRMGRMTDVKCRVEDHGREAVCAGRIAGKTGRGRRVAALFKVEGPPVHLEPYCPNPPYNSLPPSPFCSSYPSSTEP
jgi:hypothetical protein